MNQNEKIVKKLQKETGLTKELAEVSAQQLSLVHPSLRYIVDAWKNGEERNFIYNRLSLRSIQEKENCCFINSVFVMSTLLSKPTLLKEYV